jgi:agmatinase
MDAVAHEPNETPADYHRKLERAAAQLRGSRSFILSLGGDHSITAPILYGLGVDVSRLTIVHIDAHPDLLVDFQDMKESHASVMHRLWSDGASLIQIGIRTVDRSEYELSESSDRIEIHYAHSLQRPENMRALLERLRGLSGPVYLSVDVDGLDPSVIPGTGTPQPGGLTWYQTMDIFRALLLESAADVFGADVVETIPLKEVPVSEFNAAKLAFKVVSYKFFRARHG